MRLRHGLRGHRKIGVSGNDAVLVTGLGPVGLAALMLCRAMGANLLIGVETNEARIELAKSWGLRIMCSSPRGRWKGSAAHGRKRRGAPIDASASDPWPQLAIRATRDRGKIAFVGGRRHLHLRTQPGHHPRAEDYLRLLGDLFVEKWRSWWSGWYAGGSTLRSSSPTNSRWNKPLMPMP